MADLISGVLLIAAAYVGSGAFAIALFRIFFPLKYRVLGRNNVDENKLTFSYRDKAADSTTKKNRVHLLSTRELRGG